MMFQVPSVSGCPSTKNISEHGSSGSSVILEQFCKSSSMSSKMPSICHGIYLDKAMWRMSAVQEATLKAMDMDHIWKMSL